MYGGFGRKTLHRSRLLVTPAILAAVVPVWATPARASSVDSIWTGSSPAQNYLWSDISNWWPVGQYPDNNADGGANDYAVTIGAPATTLLDVSSMVDSVNITINGALSTPASHNNYLTTVDDGSIDNAGLISYSNPGSASTIHLVTDTLENSYAIRAGENGTIDLTIPSDLSTGSIANTNGTISASDGGTVNIGAGYAITGGTLSTSGTGAIELNGNSMCHSCSSGSPNKLAISPPPCPNPGPRCLRCHCVSMSPGGGVWTDPCAIGYIVHSRNHGIQEHKSGW